MKYYVSLIVALFAAAPAFAHEAVHVTPHGAEWVPVFLGLSAIAAASLIGLRVRAVSAKTPGPRK